MKKNLSFYIEDWPQVEKLCTAVPCARREKLPLRMEANIQRILALHTYFKSLLRRLNGKQQRFTFYLHPWQLDPGQPRVRVRPFFRFRHYANLDETERSLSHLLTDFAVERIATAYHVTEEDSVQRSVRYTGAYANRADY